MHHLQRRAALHPDARTSRRSSARARTHRCFFIDIAVPRNIEPSVNEIDNVFLYDIDDLQKVVENNLKGRKQEAEEAEADHLRRSRADGARG